MRPYDRQDSDTDKSYAAFRRYLEMGPDRSLERVVSAVGKKSGYSRVVARWSSRHNWVARARAYDDDENTRINAEIQRDRAKERRERLKYLRAMRAKGGEGLAKVDIESATLGEITRLLTTALDRLKEEYESVAEDDATIDEVAMLNNLSPEEQEQLAALAAKAAQGGNDGE